MSTVGNSILEQAVGHAPGQVEAIEHTIRVPAEVDVKAIRTRSGMTQREFSIFYGFKLSAVQAWEQHRRQPHTYRPASCCAWLNASRTLCAGL